MIFMATPITRTGTTVDGGNITSTKAVANTATNLTSAVNAATKEKDCVQNTSSYSNQLGKCPTLKQGNSNKDCNTILQKALRAKGEYLKCQGRNTIIDGIFGPCTTSAVKEIQRKNKLTIDGIVGPKTKAKL